MNPIIISLTSIPVRFKCLLEALRLLQFQQTDFPYQIHLYLPKEPRRGGQWTGDEDFPKFVHVHWVEDLGPITKIWYAVKEYGSDHIIVTADDDVHYNEDWLSTLVNKHNQFKIMRNVVFNKAVLCYRGRQFQSDAQYNSSKLVLAHQIDKATSVDIVTGTWGALYQPNTFKSDFFDRFVHDSYHYGNDDLYISPYLAYHNISRFVISYKGVGYDLRRQSVDPLYAINNPVNEYMVQLYKGQY